VYYRTKPLIVEALLLTHELPLGSGLIGQPGDWLVMNVDGSVSFLAEEAFKALYEPADADDYPTRFHARRLRKDAGKPRPRKNGPAPDPEPVQD
jgi:hypothetical protein